jgi:1-acyl-sn-glycerol-3-phosphate acyltransferase
VINHIAFVDPIVMVHVVPRNIVPLAKIEVYDYPIIGIFPRWWGGITVRREEMDRKAVRQAMDVLRAGEIILVAPEGTRNPQLKQAKEGFAYVGLQRRSCQSRLKGLSSILPIHFPPVGEGKESLSGFSLHFVISLPTNVPDERNSVL